MACRNSDEERPEPSKLQGRVVEDKIWRSREGNSGSSQCGIKLLKPISFADAIKNLWTKCRKQVPKNPEKQTKAGRL